MYIDLQVKYWLFLSDFNKNWIVSTDFRHIPKYQISWKSVQWEQSCSKQTNGRTDTTKLTFTFRNFANAPEHCWCHRNDADTTVRAATVLQTVFGQCSVLTVHQLRPQILAQIFLEFPQFFRQIQIWYPYFTSTTSFQITSNSVFSNTLTCEAV
jgi:hypothetical protein